MSTAVMDRADSRHVKAVDLERFSLRKLDDLCCTNVTHVPRHPTWHDKEISRLKLTQRVDVEMVIVCVTDEHEPGGAELGRIHVRSNPANDARHRLPQHGVRQNRGVSHLQQHGRMPKERSLDPGFGHGIPSVTPSAYSRKDPPSMITGPIAAMARAPGGRPCSRVSAYATARRRPRPSPTSGRPRHRQCR